MIGSEQSKAADEPVRETDKSVKFWDRIAERYANSPVKDETSYQKKLEVTRDYLQPHMDILEIGCGTGSTAIVHAPFVKHIRAIDISPKMIEIASGKAQAGNVDNVTFEVSTVAALDVADESVDVVLGLSVLHLLEDREEVITKVYTMLKPGGVFVTSTACLGDKMRFFKFIGPVGRWLGLIPLVKVFTAKELELSFTDAGYDIDYQWRPNKGMSVFIVAKKTAQESDKNRTFNI